MTGHSDGSIIVDTNVNPDGFKSGSNELLSAIKSLTQVMKQLGTTMQAVFSGSDKAIGSSDAKIQQLEATVQSLEEKAQSLSATVAELEAKLADLSKNKPAQTPVDGVADAAQGADDKVTALETKIRELESIIASLQAQLQAATATPAAADIDTGEAEAKIAMLEDRIQELENAIAPLERSGGNTTAPKVDFCRATEKASNLQRQIDSVSSSVDRLEPIFQRAMSGSESAMSSFEGKASALERKIAELEQALQTMGNAKIPTQQYQNLTAEIARTDQKFEALLQRQQKMESMGVSQNSKQWQSLQYDMDQVSQKYRELIALKAQFESSENAFLMGNETDEYQQMEATLASASSRLSEMRSATVESESWMRRLASAAGSVVSHIVSAVGHITGGMISGLKSAVSHTAKLVSGNKAYKKSFSGITSIIKRVGLGLLGCRGVYMILRKAVTAYMEANQGLANQLSSCWTSLGNLLGPLITKIINLVSTAIAYVTAFLKLLGITGSAASDAVESAGGAAEKAQKSLAGFDEINTLQDNSSGGGGGGGGAGSTPLPEVSLPDWTKLMIDQIKAGDWAGAATTLTTELNAMVASVDWAGIGDSVGYYLNGVLTFLATAILTFDWVGLGADLATGVNQILHSVDWANLGVVLGGKFIALFGALAGFIATLDWAQTAQALSDGVIGLLTTISTAIKNMDWQKIGNDVATFIANIDWSGIFAALSGGIGAALGGIAAFIWGLIEDAWNSVVDWWYDIAYEDGEFTIEGLLQGIWDSICGIGQWIVDNIFTPFIDGFKAAFGIHSPSTIMAEMGGYLIEGLLQGITEWWGDITSFFGDALGSLWDQFSSTWSGITSTVSSAGGYIYDCAKSTFSDTSYAVVRGIEASKLAISSGFTESKETVSKQGSEISSTVRSKFSDVASTISSKLSVVKSTISTGFEVAKNSITSKMSSALADIKNQGWASVGSNICHGIGNGINSGWGWLKSKVSGLADSLLGAAKNALGIHSPSRVFRDTVGLNIGLGIGEGVEDSEPTIIKTVGGVAEAIADEFATNSYSIPPIGIDTNGNLIRSLDNFASQITDSFTALIDRLSTIASSVKFTVPVIATGNVMPYEVSAKAASTIPANTGASLSTIQEAVSAVMEDMTGGMMAGFEATVAVLQEILEAVYGIEIGDEVIAKAVQRYQSKMAVVKGGN